MLIFTGFYAFYAACLVIQSTIFPGWANIYLSPATLSAITFSITIGFAGGFTGGYFASRGDPFWVLSGGLAGRDLGVGRADVYHPSLVYLIATATGASSSSSGRSSRSGCGSTMPWGRLPSTAVPASSACCSSGIFAAGYPTGLEGVRSSLGGQMMGIMTFFPLGFLPGYFIAWGLRKINMLRVPPEVELEGLDQAAFERDFYPEFERVDEVMVDERGETVHSDAVLRKAYDEVIR